MAYLSKSANISKSERSRCFKLSLNTTPYKYLTEYRLSMAAQLLKTTREPVGIIAASVGFRQMSHFGKCFREKKRAILRKHIVKWRITLKICIMLRNSGLLSNKFLCVTLWHMSIISQVKA